MFAMIIYFMYNTLINLGWVLNWKFFSSSKSSNYCNIIVPKILFALDKLKSSSITHSSQLHSPINTKPTSHISIRIRSTNDSTILRCSLEYLSRLAINIGIIGSFYSNHLHLYISFTAKTWPIWVITWKYAPEIWN